MPRAVVISLGNFLLDPIEELVREHAIANATVNAAPNSKINSTSIIFEQMAEGSQRAECIFVNAPQCTISEWQELQDTQVLLVYSSPELYLQQALLKDNDVNKTEALRHWVQDVENIVKLCEQNSHINLVSVDDILANPSSFIVQVFDKKVETKHNQQKPSIHQQLLLLASASFLVDQDELYELYDDALSASILFSEFSVHLSPDADFFKQQSNMLQHCASVLMSKITELNEGKDALANKASEVLALNENIAQLSKQLEIAREDINVKTAAYEDMFTQRSKTEESNKALKSELVEVEKALSKMQELVDSSKAEAVTMKNDMKLLNVHVAQLQEELEAAVFKVEKLEETEKTLDATSAVLLETNKKLEKAQDEGKLALLQIAQLQEESEAVALKAERLEETEKTLNATNFALSEANSNLTKVEDERKLALLQIAQLQEELEATAVKAKTSKETEDKLNATNTALSEANIKLSQAKDECKLASLQMAKLQEELEEKYSELENSKEEKYQLNKALAHLREEQTRQDITDKGRANLIQDAELELELASLQISYLQEELEHYYLSLQEVEQINRKGVVNTAMTKSKIQPKVFDKVFAEKLSIIGKYEAGDYRDVHINLNNVAFPSGIRLDSLRAKLIMVSGHIGIEFRAQETETPLFRVREDATDEYGPYLRYFLTTPHNLKEQQQKTVERLNASERLLIYGVINVIAERLQDQAIETTTDLTSEAWRTWRRASVEFAKHVDNLPNWLSFDDVKLREEYVTDGYEHLWLMFSNLLLGNVWRETLGLKVTANAVGKANNGEFSDNLSLEFRELEDGSAPLLTWPPEEMDEYGPLLNIALNDEKTLVELAQQDSALISHMIANLPSILDKLNTEGKELQRSTDEWNGAIFAVCNENPETLVELKRINGRDLPIEDYAKSLSCFEVVSEGNYQHIVFMQEGDNTKIKLRAENINPDTFDAEVYLEFRNGTTSVIYHDSEFYGEDSFGPFVRIPAETLLANSSEITQEFEVAIQLYEHVIDKIHADETVDELVKSLWANIVAQKKQSNL